MFGENRLLEFCLEKNICTCFITTVDKLELENIEIVRQIHAKKQN